MCFRSIQIRVPEDERRGGKESFVHSSMQGTQHVPWLFFCASERERARVLHPVRLSEALEQPPSSAGSCSCVQSSGCTLCICSLCAGGDKGLCLHTLYTCSFGVGARRCLCPHTPCTCSSRADAGRCPSLGTLCTGSLCAGGHKGPCHCTLYTCSFGVGARRALRPHTPCTFASPAGAGRCLCDGTACTP